MQKHWVSPRTPKAFVAQDLDLHNDLNTNEEQSGKETLQLVHQLAAAETETADDAAIAEKLAQEEIQIAADAEYARQLDSQFVGELVSSTSHQMSLKVASNKFKAVHGGGPAPQHSPVRGREITYAGSGHHPAYDQASRSSADQAGRGHSPAPQPLRPDLTQKPREQPQPAWAIKPKPPPTDQPRKKRRYAPQNPKDW